MITQAMLPHPRGLPERSLLNIVLCYILYNPRFWGLPLLGAPASGGSRLLGLPLLENQDTRERITFHSEEYLC
jgi:hypothetical protein